MITTAECNVVIAKFMGRIGNNAKYGNHYDKDWGQLMPVLKEIKEGFLELDLDLYDGHQADEVYAIEDAIWEDNVGGAFQAVYDLITMINEKRALSPDTTEV